MRHARLASLDIQTANYQTIETQTNCQFNPNPNCRGPVRLSGPATPCSDRYTMVTAAARGSSQHKDLAIPAIHTQNQHKESDLRATSGARRPDHPCGVAEELTNSNIACRDTLHLSGTATSHSNTHTGSQYQPTVTGLPACHGAVCGAAVRPAFATRTRILLVTNWYPAALSRTATGHRHSGTLRGQLLGNY